MSWHQSVRVYHSFSPLSCISIKSILETCCLLSFAHSNESSKQQQQWNETRQKFIKKSLLIMFFFAVFCFLVVMCASLSFLSWSKHCKIFFLLVFCSLHLHSIHENIEAFRSILRMLPCFSRTVWQMLTIQSLFYHSVQEEMSLRVFLCAPTQKERGGKKHPPSWKKNQGCSLIFFLDDDDTDPTVSCRQLVSLFMEISINEIRLDWQGKETHVVASGHRVSCGVHGNWWRRANY